MADVLAPVAMRAAAGLPLPALAVRAASPADGLFSIQTVANVPAPTSSSAGAPDFVVVTMAAGDGVPVPTTAADTVPPPPPPGPDQGPPAHPEHPGSAPDDAPSVSVNGECRLMGPFAIFVQLGLGALALMSLVFKRWRERPQRPVKIWFFDASKQVFGSVLVHMSNVFLSLLTSGRFSFKLEPGVVADTLRLLRREGAGAVDGEAPYLPNPCSFYLLNLAIDTTVGIPILIILVRLTTALVAYTPVGKPRESIQSGNYGRPPRVWWWLKQSLIYFCGLFGMKLCVLIIFLVFPWISHVGDWALSWTDGNEQVQIVFVMMLFPLIMNAMQYYIIDSFIKEQVVEHSHGLYDQLDDSDDGHDGHDGRDGHGRDHRHRHHRVHTPEHAEDGDDESSPGDDDLDLSDLSDLDDASKPKPVVPSSVLGAATLKTGSRVSVTVAADDAVYDPDVDGDSRTIIGSSASQQPLVTPKAP